jgi:hypothetical protein
MVFALPDSDLVATEVKCLAGKHMDVNDGTQQRAAIYAARREMGRSYVCT